MEIRILVDNNTLIDHYFFAEPGLSYFIKDENINILFDVGYSDLFIKNANKINIDLLNLDFVVISHGHCDHTWGLDPFIKLYSEAKLENVDYNLPQIVAHPFAFNSKEFDNSEIGSIISQKKLSKHFKINLSKEPVWLTKRLVFLGEIERKYRFENNVPIGKTLHNGIKQDDYVIDDSALVYKSLDGLVIITGCSHAGICNIIEYAKKVCKEDRIIDIIGGFHLLNPSKEQLENTKKYIKEAAINQIHACHCTDLQSKIELSKVVNLKETGVGLKIEYN